MAGGLAHTEQMRLSHDATGRMEIRRPSRGKAARAVWRLTGARVPRRRRPVLRESAHNVLARADGRKALNVNALCGEPMDPVTN